MAQCHVDSGASEHRDETRFFQPVKVTEGKLESCSDSLVKTTNQTAAAFKTDRSRSKSDPEIPASTVL